MLMIALRDLDCHQNLTTVAQATFQHPNFFSSKSVDNFPNNPVDTPTDRSKKPRSDKPFYYF